MNKVKNYVQGALANVESGIRNNGEQYYYFDDKKYQEMCHEAHGGILPDDWKYRFIVESLRIISDHIGDDDTLSDIYDDCIEDIYNDAEVYNSVISSWLASNVCRGEYVNDAMDEFGRDGDIYAIISRGMMAEKIEVFNAVFEYLSKME